MTRKMEPDIKALRAFYREMKELPFTVQMAAIRYLLNRFIADHDRAARREGGR